MYYSFKIKSNNVKTGKIPVTYSSKKTCPSTCAFKGNGCYAESGPVAIFWAALTQGFYSITWNALCAFISALPKGALWRHNVAGDLPHARGKISHKLVRKLIAANEGKRGFTYTHHNAALRENRAIIREANQNGLTINLSGNSLKHADALASLKCGPVVAVLPSTVQGNQKIFTPKGRRVVICPATYREDVTCKSCALCAVATRQVIVGFPAHGARAKKVNEICSVA